MYAAVGGSRANQFKDGLIMPQRAKDDEESNGDTEDEAVAVKSAAH